MLNNHSLIPWGSFRGRQVEKWGSFRGRDHFGGCTDLWVIYGWDRTSTYTGAASSRYQSISDLNQYMNEMRPDHNPGNSMPYSIRIVCGFFTPHRVVRRGLRFIVLIREDLKVLTICRCIYKGSTFSSVILRPWVLVRPESNSQPPAQEPDAQPTEPSVAVSTLEICLFSIFTPRIGWERLQNANRQLCNRRGGGFLSSLIGESLFTIFASLTYASPYLMTLIK